jgi:methylenetetrahydrofolate reductase (NADPH)
VSRLSDLLGSPGAVVVTAEFPSIDGGGMTRVAAAAERLGPWFDAVNATDNPAAHAHASNVAVAIAMLRHGVEPIMQVVCRDKNRLAIQADLVGAALHGVENVSLLTGDDVTAGDEPEARRVFDLDGPQAIRTVTVLSGGAYLSGRPIDPPPVLFPGAVENPGAPPLDDRVERVAMKASAGARFLQLQICYHRERLEAFCERVAAAGLAGSEPGKVALLPTVVLVRGVRALRFMHDRVPGIEIPQSTIDRVGDAADQAEEAYRTTLELAGHALELPGVRGLHVTDFRHDGTVERLMRDLGREPRPRPIGETVTAQTAA